MPSNAATKNYVAVTVAHVSAHVFPCLTWWRKRASEELDAFRCEWPAVFDLHHRALSLPQCSLSRCHAMFVRPGGAVCADSAVTGKFAGLWRKPR